MIEVEVPLPGGRPSLPAADIIESVCTTAGLQLSLKGTLAQYPGSVHWHFKKGKQRGTLEFTWWERENRLWFKVAAGRSGEWIDAELLADLSSRIQQAWLGDLKKTNSPRINGDEQRPRHQRSGLV